MSRIAEYHIGPDYVEVFDEGVAIYATHEMTDWTLREFCRLPIYFLGRKYFLLRKEAAPAPYVLCYELTPWPADMRGEATRFVTYDESYVEQRERACRADRRHGHLHALLFCLYPFLGFFWSGFKQRVLTKIGFEAASITWGSIMFAFGCFLLEGVFVLYFHLGFAALIIGPRLFGLPMLWFDWLLFVILPLDCAMRYGQLISWEDSPGGFLEWAIRPLFKKY